MSPWSFRASAFTGLLTVALCCGCGADSDERAEPSSSEPPGRPAESLNGCAPDAFEDRADGGDDERVVLIGADGLVFTPRCLAIANGQTVRFEGSLAAHPIAPGNPDAAAAGSPDNPIVATSSGAEVEFTFDTSGTFAYYCELHAFGAGNGMAGAILVK